MNILMIFHLCPNPPPRDLGPAKRMFPFLVEVMKRHDVSVLSFGSAEEERRFREHFAGQCKRIEFVNNARPRYVNVFRRAYAILRGKGVFYTLHSHRMQRKIDEIVRSQNIDLIHCSTAMLGFYRFPKGVPLVGDTHNVEYNVFFRSFLEARGLLTKAVNFVEYALTKRAEVRNWSIFDTVIATTDRDGDIMKKDAAPGKITVIQNGVDPAFLSTDDQPTEPKTLVFTGLMTYFPNDHGILHFLDKIFPLVLEMEPQTRVSIVGKGPSRALQARASAHVIVTGFVDDVRPYMARSELYIIPLLIGGGIRGKALEAMAMRKPIVSTTVGCEGILLRHGESALIADDPRGFADAILTLFKNRELRDALKNNAYNTVIREYDWEQKGRQLEEVYQSLARRSRTQNRTDDPLPGMSVNNHVPSTNAGALKHR